MNKSCVYLHKNSKTGEVFYVGSGNLYEVKWKSRPYQFTKSCRTAEWVEYVDNNGLPDVEIIKSGLSKVEALLLEEQLIVDIGIDNLTNVAVAQRNTSYNIKRSKESNTGRKHLESHREAWKISNKYRYRAVEAIDRLTGSVVHEFESANMAARVLGLSQGAISNACNGHSKTSGGFVWKFKN